MICRLYVNLVPYFGPYFSVKASVCHIIYDVPERRLIEILIGIEYDGEDHARAGKTLYGICDVNAKSGISAFMRVELDIIYVNRRSVTRTLKVKKKYLVVKIGRNFKFTLVFGHGLIDTLVK